MTVETGVCSENLELQARAENPLPGPKFVFCKERQKH